MSTSDTQSDVNDMNEKFDKDLYFRDGIRKIDFVLVYKKTSDKNTLEDVNFFIKNLIEKGIETEEENGTINDDIIFVKLYAPRHLLLECASIFQIDLLFKLTGYKPPVKVPYAFMKNELNSPDPNSPVYKRANHIFTHPSDLTSAERAFLIYKILQRNEYGTHKSNYGIEGLLQKKIFLAGYPLHNGGYEWTETGPLNERQLLKKYWSSAEAWKKQQPLDLIQLYLGPQYGFYFAFVGYYIRMLIPLAILGLLSIIGGIIASMTFLNTKSKELCTSEILMCPECHLQRCDFPKLKKSCFYAYLSSVLDNPITLCLATMATIWTTFFTEFWRRKESILQLRWSLTTLQVDLDIRPEFEKKARRRISPIDWKMEPYLPPGVVCFHYTVTVITILLLIFLVLLGIFGVMIYRKFVFLTLLKNNITIVPPRFIASITGAMISLVFIVTFEMFYKRVAFWLTNLENPRTQDEFDNFFTFKIYTLAFVNNYSVVFYIAFFKEMFHTHPGDEAVYSELFGIRSDRCDPSGCIADLTVQLLIIMVGKNIYSLLQQIFLPVLLVFIKRFLLKKKKQLKVNRLPQWEEDFLLNPTDRYQLIIEFTQMIIQYGFVTFFIAGFPAAPIFALLNNLMELRIDALKLTKTSRRPVPKKVSNLGAWNAILDFVTYMAIAINALLIAFTSDCVPREIYRNFNDKELEGFVNHSLSIFKVDDFKEDFAKERQISYCYYKGMRFPPDHETPYKLNDEYWFQLALRLITIVLYEHIFMSLTGVVASSIPDIPFSVKKYLHLEQNQEKELKIQALNEGFLDRVKRARDLE